MRQPIDLTGPEAFRDGPPVAFFAELRSTEPVWWHGAAGSWPGFWVVSRYRDVQDVLARPTVFINAQGITIDPAEPAGAGAGEEERGQGALSYTDPPEHRELRKVLAPHFTPGRIRRIEPELDALASTVVGDYVDHGGGDFVEVVADRFPLAVLARLLDLPDPTMRALGAFVRQAPDADGEPSPAAFLAAMDELVARRRAAPGDDLISALVNAEGSAGALVAPRLGGILIQLAIAGNETTRAALGHAAWILADHPDVQRELRGAPELVGAFVEETLRFRPPVHYIRRTAAETAELGSGRQAVAGEIVYLSVVSANRDEAVFDHPDRFELTRFAGRTTHLSLGFAEHHCLGAATARTELRVLLSALLGATEHIALDGPAERDPSSTLMDGLAHLPLRVTPARVGA